MVLKAAPETALDAMVFAEAAAEAGLPPGVLNIVAGGAEAGAHLVAHPGVDKVAFTGSTAAGRAIGEICGRLMRPVTLELGGKSAAIILDDADLDATIAGLRSASFVNNGQTCHLSSRILAPRSRYDEVVDAMAALADSLAVGDPLDPSDRDRTRWSANGSANGYSTTSTSARPTAPNSLPAARFRRISPAAGSSHRRSSPTWTTPTGSRRRRSSARCWPSLPTTTTTKPSRSPTTASTASAAPSGRPTPSAATDVARAVHTGTIGVNDYQLDIRAPFGGVKASGLGRELGPEGLDAYRTVKSIYRVGPA